MANWSTRETSSSVLPLFEGLVTDAQWGVGLLLPFTSLVVPFFFLLLLGQRNWQTQEEEATGALQAGIPPLLTSGDHLPTLILSRPVKIEIAIVYEL